MKFKVGDKIWFKEYVDITDKDEFQESWIGYGHSGIITSIVYKSVIGYNIKFDNLTLHKSVFFVEKSLLKMIDISKMRGEIINKLLDEV